jgi:hypothetical protein
LRMPGIGIHTGARGAQTPAFVLSTERAAFRKAPL